LAKALANRDLPKALCIVAILILSTDLCYLQSTGLRMSENQESKDACFAVSPFLPVATS
jgi:hypothetical protein